MKYLSLISWMLNTTIKFFRKKYKLSNMIAHRFINYGQSDKREKRKEKLSLILVTDSCRLPSLWSNISIYRRQHTAAAEARLFGEGNSERSKAVSCEDTGLLCRNDMSLREFPHWHPLSLFVLERYHFLLVVWRSCSAARFFPGFLNIEPSWVKEVVGVGSCDLARLYRILQRSYGFLWEPEI